NIRKRIATITSQLVFEITNYGPRTQEAWSLAEICDLHDMATRGRRFRGRSGIEATSARNLNHLRIFVIHDRSAARNPFTGVRMTNMTWNSLTNKTKPGESRGRFCTIAPVIPVVKS